MIRLSPVLEGMRTYPFLRLTEAKRKMAARGVSIIDFGIGEPREETPAFIREALARAVVPRSTYPAADGLSELREAVARWCGHRFGVGLDPESEIVPTLGSKEAIFHLAEVFAGDLVALTVPGYPVAARGAAFAGKEVLELPLRADADFEPDLDAVEPATWDRVSVLWLNYPNNPTAATVSTGFYERAAALARRHEFVLASDEAYSELYFGARPPASALQVADRRHVCALNTLSKRSSMPGYRSGFIAGDPEIIAALKHYRPNAGVAPQEFVQRAAVAAWGDETHVDEVRELYRAKRDVLMPALESAGLVHVGGDASFFLWLADAEEAAGALLEEGIVFAPGSLFGPAGAGYARVALVPTLEECRRAAELISRWRAAPR